MFTACTPHNENEALPCLERMLAVDGLIRHKSIESKSRSVVDYKMSG